MNQLEESAIRYADNGWHVFPLFGIVDGRCECNTNCGSPGKHPRVSQGLHAATDDPERIRSWWKRWPNSNVGVRTGKVSGVYVLDVDNKRSVDLGNGILVGEGENSLKSQEIQIGKLPHTLTQITGSGGIHLAYSYPTNLKQEGNGLPNTAGILPSVDTRGDGGYIVAPPSLHQSGNRYRWIEPDQPLVSLPERWISFISKYTTQGGHSLDLELTPDFRVREGEGRHDWLFRMGSKLRGQHGLPKVALWGALSGYNRLVLSPPLEPKEVEHIVDSCLEYEPSVSFDRLVDPSPPQIGEGEDLATLLSEFLAEDVPPAISLISNILHRGECMILGGPPNIGKTWVAMDMMMGISSGTEFASRFPCTQAPVLFIDEEGSKRVDHKRFSMLLEGREESAAEYPIYTKISSGIRLDDERGRVSLARLIERYRPGAIFLDSLVRVHGGNESDNRQMAELFRLVRQLQEVYQTSFIFTHHIRKPSKESQDDPIWMLRGASDIQGFPDSILVGLPTDDSQEIRMVHTKMRDGERLDPFLLRVVVNDGRATVAYREVADTGIHNPSREAILATVQGNVPLLPETIAARTGLGLATVKEHLQVLEASGAVRPIWEAKTKYYQSKMGG